MRAAKVGRAEGSLLLGTLQLRSAMQNYAEMDAQVGASDLPSKTYTLFKDIFLLFPLPKAGPY